MKLSVSKLKTLRKMKLSVSKVKTSRKMNLLVSKLNTARKMTHDEAVSLSIEDFTQDDAR